MEYTIFLWLVGITTFHFLLERGLEMLNDSHKSSDFPSGAEGIYDQEQYEKWVAYDRIKGRFGWMVSTVNFLALQGMLWLGGFRWLDNWLRNAVTDHDLLLPLIFFGALGLGSSVLNLPFSWYGLFHIEDRFGFNKTTPRTFWLDRLKGLLVSVLLGGAIGAGVLLIYYRIPESFWILAWVLMGGITLFLNIFYTSTLARLFNKLTPLEPGPLRDAIQEYCQKVGYNLKNVFVIDGSRRSTRANAYFSGMGPRKSIVLYDTLIEKFEEDEIISMLAHEVGHYRKKHITLSTVLSLGQMGLTLFLLDQVLNIPYFSLAIGSQPSFHLGLLVFGMLYSPISLILGLGMNALSRKNEFEADAFSRKTANGASLQSALKRLASENLVNLTPHPVYTFFHASHPPLLRRLAALETGQVATEPAG